MDLNHHDIHGCPVKVGDRVRVFGGNSNGPSAESIAENDGRTFEVLLVEGPLPGSRSTRDGWGTLLLNGHERGNEVSNGNFVVEARFTEVV